MQFVGANLANFQESDAGHVGVGDGNVFQGGD